MQRPTRIIVFGVFCLIIGAVSGFKNTMEAGLSIAGPDTLDQMRTMMEQMGQPLSKSQDQDFDVQIKALNKPVYRIVQGIESVASMVMAAVLFLAGIGLLRDRTWSLKLAKGWALYAVPAAAVSVVLSMRYVYPEVPEYSAGSAMFSSAMMLIVLWAFPLLLLRQLPTPQVKAYLAQRDQQRAGKSAMPSAAPPSDTPAQATPPAPPASPSVPPPSSPPPATRPGDNTWRDDPWNDPNSR